MSALDVEETASFSVGWNETAGRADLAFGGLDSDGSAEANDEVDTQLVFQHLAELDISEATVGEDRDVLHPPREEPTQLTKKLVLVAISASCQRGGLDGLPENRGAAAMLGDQAGCDPVVSVLRRCRKTAG
jgi:hypothetical protein